MLKKLINWIFGASLFAWAGFIYLITFGFCFALFGGFAMDYAAENPLWFFSLFLAPVDPRVFPLNLVTYICMSVLFFNNFRIGVKGANDS